MSVNSSGVWVITSTRARVWPHTSMPRPLCASSIRQVPEKSGMDDCADSVAHAAARTSAAQALPFNMSNGGDSTRLLRERLEIAATDAAVGHNLAALFPARFHAGPERSLHRPLNPFRLHGGAVVMIDEKSFLHLAAAFRASWIRHGRAFRFC